MEYINFQKIDKPNNFNFYLKSLILIFLFYISVSSVNYIRANYFYVGKSADFVFDKDDKTLNTKANTQTKIPKNMPPLKKLILKYYI